MSRCPDTTPVLPPGATNSYYAIKDHLGSVHALVDASGSVVESYSYDAWGTTVIRNAGGAAIAASGFGNRFMFQGGDYSAATGLCQFRARWYAPELGRWLSPDPIGLEGGLNLYEFCANNPVNLRDPSGLFVVAGEWDTGYPIPIHVAVYDGDDKGESGNSRIANGDNFASAAKHDTGVFTYDMRNDPDLQGLIEYLKQLKSQGLNIGEVAIYDHGQVSRYSHASIGQEYNKSELLGLPNAKRDMCELGSLLEEGGRIDMMGCEVGMNKRIMQDYANSFGRKVTASSADVDSVIISNLLDWHRPWLTVETVEPEK